MKGAVSETTQEAAPTFSLRRFGALILSWPAAFLSEIGELAKMCGQTFYWGVRPPYRWRLWIASLDFIGVGSIFIVGLNTLFVGMVFGLQLVYGFRQFGAENQTGAVVGLSLSRELAPVFSALMVSSRTAPDTTRQACPRSPVA